MQARAVFESLILNWIKQWKQETLNCRYFKVNETTVAQHLFSFDQNNPLDYIIESYRMIYFARNLKPALVVLDAKTRYDGDNFPGIL